MINKFILCVIAVLFSNYVINAQAKSGTYASYFNEANYLMLEENYEGALKNYTAAYMLDSSSANINFNLGYCLLKSSNKKASAERHLAVAAANVSKNYSQDDASEKGAPPTAHFMYAKALHLNYKFDEAIAQYEIFEKNYAKDKLYKQEVQFYKQQSIYAKALVASPINVKIENLGDSINSGYPDFSPVLSGDETMIVYTTRRNTSTGGEKALDGQYYEDIVVAYKDENGKWGSPKSISAAINTSGNDAAINLTPDGQTLISYQDIGKGGDVYFSTWDGKDWSPIQEFGSDVNTKYWETHACLSADNNTLFFVSDRPGGFGGRDIYRCRKLPNGKWSLAQNLGPTINTKFDEDGPFIHPDAVTLMFASKGHKSMGGFDILFSIIDEEQKFSEPINMGYPINTPDDDVFFVTSPDGKRGYFSSDKEGGFGEKDIYMMYIPDAKEKPLALFKGLIIPAEGERLPEDLEIVVTNKETGEIVGKYKPKENGNFSTILPPNKNYTFSYQSKGEEFYTEDLFVSNEVSYQEIKKEIALEPVALLGKVKIKDKSLILNTLVFNNSTDKKPVPNAKVTLTEKGGGESSFVVDAEGKKDGTPLAPEKLYSLVAESNNKKSKITTFNTLKVKGAKSITQILYIDYKPAGPNDLSLNTLVTNTKRLPLENSNIFLTGSDGSKFEGETDSRGYVKNILLSKDVTYELIAEYNGISSIKESFSTAGATKNVFSKTLIIGAANANASNNDIVGTNCKSHFGYLHYFSYDKNDLDEKNDFIRVVNGITKKSKECDSVVVKIYSSASQVPTRAFAGGNKELAQLRGANLQAKITSAVTANGGDISKIVFSVHSSVRGPSYMNDASNRAKYGKYQYVKAVVK